MHYAEEYVDEKENKTSSYQQQAILDCGKVL